MITLEPVYIFAGIVFLSFGIAAARDEGRAKRFVSVSFYFLLAITFLFGSRLSNAANGSLSLGLIVAGAFWRSNRRPISVTEDQQREIRAWRHKSLLFLPVLLVPFCAVIGATVLKGVRVGGRLLIDPQAATLIWIYCGILLGLVCAMALFRPPLTAPVTEGRRLIDAVGWALLLPQMLAALGAVFTVSGVGAAVGKVFSDYLPVTNPQAALVMFAIGMAAFTIVMGNAFAAFPVMMAGVGLPLVVGKFGGNVVPLAAIGMLSGFCGTLLTPMAANFNLVPAALLELKDHYAVIRAQAPTAVLLFIANVLLLCLVVYR